MSEQTFFDLGEPEELPAPAARTYGWNWWDAWPNELSEREQMIWQVRRDLRALEECDEDEQEFFASRIAAFKELLQ